MAQINEMMDEFDDMEFLDEDELLDCDQLTVDIGDNHTEPSILDIINGEILMIDFAVKKSTVYDLQSIKNDDSKESEHNQISTVSKYRNLQSEYQVVIELEMVPQTKQKAVVHVIGALIPKGYVHLNGYNDSKDIMWFDSMHNLLLKKCKIYSKLSHERIQAQLSSMLSLSED